MNEITNSTGTYILLATYSITRMLSKHKTGLLMNNVIHTLSTHVTIHCVIFTMGL